MTLGARSIIPRTAPTGLSVLIVDEDAFTRDRCMSTAMEAGLEVHSAATTEQGLALLERLSLNILITDLNVPQLGGLEVLMRARAKHPQIAIIVLTQHGTIETALMQGGPVRAIDCISKPLHLGELRTKLDRLVFTMSLDEVSGVLRKQVGRRLSCGGIIGVSPKMQHVYEVVEKVSRHNCPVLILGETGTGKELVARSIHFSGSRQHKPFVPVDCSGLVPSLIETELFGCVKGAFTGAAHSRAGLLESANGGTVFLDEIGDLPFDLQAKLLRALQELEVRPVGSINRVHIDIRVVAATNRDLETASRSGGFRQDLYFRLNVINITIPPLRERKGDIPLLVDGFLEKFSDPQRPARAISADALRCLISYDWPGNVRELENAVEHAMVLGSGPMLDIGDLPFNLHHTSCEKLVDANELLPIEELEHRAIVQALRETGGARLAAARLLGIGKTTLYRKLKQYGLEPFSD